MTTTTLDMKVQDFLAQKRIAVAGVSRDRERSSVSDLISHRLKTTGHEVFAVNPHMQTFEGDRCYPDLQSIPGGVDRVVHHHAADNHTTDRTRLQRRGRSTRVDASVDGEGHECVVRGHKVLPSARHQCDCRCVSNDVRRGR